MKQKHKLSLSRKDKEKRRLKAGKMFEKDITQAEIARKLGVTPAAVKYWHDAWRKKGFQGLKSKGHPGFASKFTPEKKAKLKKIIIKGAKHYGYPTDFWTINRIMAVTRKELRLSFKKTWIWMIVLSLGFTCQKPQTKSKERNETAIADWKANTWPRLKKMGSQA
jgi:transposase